MSAGAEEGGDTACWALQHCSGKAGTERWPGSPGGPPWWAAPEASLPAEVFSWTVSPGEENADVYEWFKGPYQFH